MILRDRYEPVDLSALVPRLGPEFEPHLARSDDTTLIRWANTIGPQALQALNDRVAQLASSLEVKRGRKLRVDTAAVETGIQYPTDSAPLGDGVRGITRLLLRISSHGFWPT